MKPLPNPQQLHGELWSRSDRAEPAVWCRLSSSLASPARVTDGPVSPRGPRAEQGEQPRALGRAARRWRSHRMLAPSGFQRQQREFTSAPGSGKFLPGCQRSTLPLGMPEVPQPRCARDGELSGHPAPTDRPQHIFSLYPTQIHPLPV